MASAIQADLKYLVLLLHELGTLLLLQRAEATLLGTLHLRPAATAL
jgi:hypothetical protein